MMRVYFGNKLKFHISLSFSPPSSRNGRRREQHPDPRHQLCVHAAGPGDRGLSGSHLARDSADLLRAAVLSVFCGVLPVWWHRQVSQPFFSNEDGCRTSVNLP